MKYEKGWSSTRGRATHYVHPYRVTLAALCRAPIRIRGDEGTPKLKKLEICDHCQRERRKRGKGR